MMNGLTRFGATHGEQAITIAHSPIAPGDTTVGLPT
jgi:hypothetical protein